MIVSLAWLRSLCPFEAAPEAVAAKLTSRGLTVDAVTAVADDTVLEIDVPANRPDCLGHLGVARELSAAFGVPLRAYPPPGKAPGTAPGRRIRVQIDEPELCARYSARIVSGVRVAPSPPWVVRRLEACGLRSINNVVDASNLVLLELGHPIHTFDLARIPDGAIVVRRARAGERIVTLDGVDRALTESMLLIADAKKAVAIAGVMGGEASQITEGTTDVLVEAAWFLPQSVRATRRALALPTDASHRFERGADPEAVLAAQDRAAELLAELAHGTPAAEVIDEWPVRRAPKTLAVTPARVRSLLGYSPAPEEVLAALAPTGLAPTTAGDGAVRITVPSWRVDLDRDADVVEEIARHLGYDRIPSHLPPAGGEAPPPDPIQMIEERARDRFAAHGCAEAFCYSMIAVGEDDPFVLDDAPAPLSIVNPIAEPLARLRRSLVPGLLRLVDTNVRRGADDVRLFEVGRVFRRADETFPEEWPMAAFAWKGAASPRHWSAPARLVRLTDAAGLLESLLEAARPRALLRRVAPEGPIPAGLHPGRIAIWVPDGAPPSFGAAVAWVASLHPRLGATYEVGTDIYLGEVRLGALLDVAQAAWSVAPVPKVPSVFRDLSIIASTELSFARIAEAFGRETPPAPARLVLTDRYLGPPLAEGEASLTIRVILEPLERTLTDAEVEDYRSRLVSRLRSELNVGLRE